MLGVPERSGEFNSAKSPSLNPKCRRGASHGAVIVTLAESTAPVTARLRRTLHSKKLFHETVIPSKYSGERGRHSKWKTESKEIEVDVVTALTRGKFDTQTGVELPEQCPEALGI